MRYKRKRFYRSKVVKMKFQSFFDISTQDGSMQIISVNAGGNDVIKRLAPFFSAYKYYKLGGVSFKMIPASTLPVDPSGLSYEENDPGVDPRDQLTPGMCRITNGEDILENIAGLSEDEQHALYNNMLLDPRWYKWMLQSGVKRFGKPRYWQIGQLHQDKWPGAVQNMPKYDVAPISGDYRLDGTIAKLDSFLDADTEGAGYQGYFKDGSDPRGIFQTGRRGVLGWMPTDSFQLMRGPDGALVRNPLIASVPEVELFKILMPPAYKTKYYYRAFVTETVYFKDPIVMNLNGFRPIDVFRYNPMPLPMSPKVESAQGDFTEAVMDERTGGNDGSD